MDILEKMERASKMPTPPVQWCGEAADEIRSLRAKVQDAFDLGYRAAGGTIIPTVAVETKIQGCDCGFVGLRHHPSCKLYPLTAEGGFAGAYPPGGGDDDSDIW